jgi:hypothetical protein
MDTCMVGWDGWGGMRWMGWDGMRAYLGIENGNGNGNGIRKVGMRWDRMGWDRM